MLRKSNVVETWFSKEEESVSHNNNNNGLINRILKLENELNKALNENTILKTDFLCDERKVQFLLAFYLIRVSTNFVFCHQICLTD